MAKESLLKLAKGGGKKNETTAKKSVEKEKIVVPITPAEERDMKAKAKVEELLQDVPMTIEKQEVLLDVAEDEPQKGVEWLEEQMTLLSDSNQNLIAELELAKGDYQRLFEENQRLKSGVNSSTFDDGQVMANVIAVFNELQSNYMQFGQNFIIYPVAFMNRLVMFFPFLQNEKRF
jgi:hypothetical protein